MRWNIHLGSHVGILQLEHHILCTAVEHNHYDLTIWLPCSRSFQTIGSSAGAIRPWTNFDGTTAEDLRLQVHGSWMDELGEMTNIVVLRVFVDFLL
eukprot:Skav202046  [mRNA]  locus=scaffold1138:378245:380042:+ [translate_table: standard]